MPNRVTTIGVVLTDLHGMDTCALKYLVLYLNTLQTSFEFQILPTESNNAFLSLLDSSQEMDCESVEREADAYFAQYREWLAMAATEYELANAPPDGYVILSVASLADEYFVTGGDNWVVVALGNWKRHMAPPSLVEFFLTILIGAAIDIACGDDFPTRHHATKGCVFDFAASIGDAKFSVLTGFLCGACCKTIKRSSSQQTVDDVHVLLDKAWMGDSRNPTDVAITAKKLGYDLFYTRGIKQTLGERLSATFEQEAAKGLFQIALALIVAALLLWLGLKGM